MDETTLKIAIASFFHDMGKFAGKDVFKLSKDEFDTKAADFLPVRDSHYTHAHALYTAEFISRFIDFLPDEFNRPWGNGDGLIKLAASHHSPSSAMEWIVAEADRISSGMDRKQYDAAKNASVSVSDFEKTRLVPLLECLDYNEKSDYSSSDRFEYAYALLPLTPDSIFPRKKKEVQPIDRQAAKAEYAALFKAFSKDLGKIPHRDNICIWFEHFESLVKQYTAHVPAARVGNVIPDVSLYDHLRTTAALATALYCYHRDTDTLYAIDVQKEDPEKFLIVTGDFHGIQNFIFSGYGDTRKYRSKLLRGRSFYVSVLTEMASHLLCSRMGLPFTSVVLNAGGKFTLLAPNTKDSILAAENVQQKIEKWFVDQTCGESGISLSMVSASPADFKGGRYQELHDRITRAATAKKLNRIDLDIYGGVIENYFDSPGNEPCPFCGKRPVHKNAIIRGTHQACAICRDHVFLGENLVKKDAIAILGGKSDAGVNEKMLVEPLFGEFQLIFPDDAMESTASQKALLKYWTIAQTSALSGEIKTAQKYFHGYVPVYSEEDRYDPRISIAVNDDEEDITIQILESAPKTLGHIAELSKNISEENKLSGVEALGVLKADVDHLGLLMACGLEEKLYSISRIATLSRQINDYFAVYLPYFLSSHSTYNNIYTVFAGGDDLFLIGPWNRIMEFAPELASNFSEYVCKNPNVTISAGLSFHKSHTPVSTMADAAESALERSKHKGRNRLTVFDEVVEWNEAEELYDIHFTLEKWLNQGFISPTMLYKLNTFVSMADQEKKLTSAKKGIGIRDMGCMRWRALLAYSIERNILKMTDPAERGKRVAEVNSNMAEWLTRWGGSLRIPLWYVQYNRR